MRKISISVGQVFGHLQFIGEEPSTVSGNQIRQMVLVRCECGKEMIVRRDGMLKAQHGGKCCHIPSIPREIPVGTVFGHLTVVESGMQPRRGNRTEWASRCLCECGRATTTYNDHLVNGRSRSCGCKLGVSTKAHNGAYRSWEKMKDRVLNVNHEAHGYYGGKGITICDKWLTFAGFFEDMGDRPQGKTLDRIDNALGYFKENCRWSTVIEQNNNKTSCVVLTIDGVTKNVTQWAMESGNSRFLIYGRIKLGWDAKRAVWTPSNRTKKASA